VPRLSFEFTREFLDDAFACAEQLGSLADTSFNFTLSGAWAFHAPRWGGLEELRAALNDVAAKSDDPLLWGDVYARAETAGSV
jgi:hypothetical protein